MQTILKRITSFPTQFFLILLGALAFIPFLGNVPLFDWDEINFAESAREMLVTGNYRMVQIDFQPFYEKPPLFIWFQACCMHFFGINEFAARLPNALIGIGTLLVVFNAGKRYFSSQLGILWALVFASSFLPFAYFKSGIIDPTFNFFIFLSLYNLFKISIKDDFESYKLSKKNHRWFLVASALFAGLAVLTKGPVALLLIVSTVSVVLLINKGKLNFNLTDLLLWSLVVVFVISTWLSFEIKANRFQFIDEFIRYQIRLFSTGDAGHGEPFYYHFVVLLIGCFPASILCVAAFKKNNADTLHQVSFKRWMIVLLCVVLFIFSIVKTKIVHYSSLCYFPITFLAAYYLNHWLENKVTYSWKVVSGILILGLLLATGVGLAPYAMHEKWFQKIPIHDDFAVASLGAAVSWKLIECWIGIAFGALLIFSFLLKYYEKKVASIFVLLMSCHLFIYSILFVFTPKIEMYSQQAMIEFLQSRSFEKCHLIVHGFKSYAHFFYGQKKVPITAEERDGNFLLNTPQTLPVYVISKINMLDDLPNKNNLKELYRKNGFVFFEKIK